MRNYLFAIYLTFILCCTLLDLSLCEDVVVNTPHGINGKLQILQADSFTENQHRKFFLLHTSEGEVYHLNFNASLADKIDDLNSDSHFEFSGLKLHPGNLDEYIVPSPPNAPTIWGSNHHHFHVQDFSQLFNFPHLEATKEIFDPQESVSLRRMVVLLLNFKDASIDCSTTEIEARLWQNTFSVKSAYERNSYGTIEFYGDLEYDNQWDIYGPFDLDYSLSSNCAPDDWATQGEYLATQSGVDLSRYQHRIYVLPSKSSNPCHWEGLGWIGCGLYCRAWINTCDRMEVFVHELGHNVGFTHAASDINEMGNIITYGDPTAFMGNGWFTSSQELCFNAPHRSLGGWVPQEKTVQITSDEGIYTLSPLNSFPENSENFQVLTYQNQDNGVTYYFSYVTLNSQYSQQCLVHYLSNSSAPSCFVKSLNNSDYFVDKNQRFSVTQLSMSEREMSLWVVVGCKEKDTIILGSNGTVLSAKAGEKMNVTVTISNKDSPLCTPVTYKLIPNLPSGWEYELESDLLLAPGQTCTVDMWLTPHKDASGSHSISLSVNGISADETNVSPIHTTTFYSTITIEECSPQAFQMQLLDSNPYYSSAASSTTLSFSVVNTDQEICDDSTVEFSAKFPEGWKYTFASSSLTLRPGEFTSNSITYTPPLGNFSSIQIEIQLEDSKTPQHFTSISTQLSHELGCDEHPTLVLGTSVLSLNTRETVSTFLEISSTNGLHCPPVQYTFSTMDVEISIVPAILTVFPSSSQSVIIMYTAPMMLDSRNQTVMVSVDGGGNSWEYELEIAVEAVPCVPKSPTFYWACPDRLDNTTAIGVRCFYYLSNNDNWPCPTSTWKLSFDTSIPTAIKYTRPMTLPIFPGNSSSWVPVDFEFKSFPLNMSQISVTCNVTDVTSESQVANLHFAWFQHPMDLGACIKTPPIVDFQEVEFEMFAGDTLPISYSIQNPYNDYCDWVDTYDGSVDSYAYLVTVNQMPVNLSGLFSPGSFSFKPGESRSGAQIILTHHIFDNSEPTNQTYELTFDFYDPQNKTSLRTHINITIHVLSECYKRTPFVSIVDSLESIPVGQQRYMNFTVNVTNKDYPGCSSTNFNLGSLVPRPGPGWAMTLSTTNLNLEPNATGQFTVAVTTRENLPPGNYSLNVFVSESGIINHSANNHTSIEVMCPNPRPVTKINAKAIIPFFSFGLQEGPVYLSWDGCMTPLWCCCPCTYRIERNGEYIGTSPYRNFTDSSNLHAGVHYVYNITTIDRNGVASSSSTCGTTIEFVIQALSVRDLLVFMSIAISILLFVGLVLYLVLMFFKRKQDRKRGVYTPYCPVFITHFCGTCLHKFRKPKNSNKPLLELDHITNEEEQGFLDEETPEKRHSLLKFMGNDD